MRITARILAAATLALAAGTALAQKTQLLVYTALETDQLKAYQEGFNKVHPDIEIKWVRDSTGVITAKLLAEKANPQADAVMGVAASSLALLDKNGMLEPYAPQQQPATRMRQLPQLTSTTVRPIPFASPSKSHSQHAKNPAENCRVFYC